MPTEHGVQIRQRGRRQTDLRDDALEVFVNGFQTAHEIRQAAIRKAHLQMLGKEMPVGERIGTVARVQPLAIVVEGVYFREPVEATLEVPLPPRFKVPVPPVEALLEVPHFGIERERPVKRMPDEREAGVASRLRVHFVNLPNVLPADHLDIRFRRPQRCHNASRGHLRNAEPKIAVFPGDDLLGLAGDVRGGARHAQRVAAPSAHHCAGHVQDHRRLAEHRHRPPGAARQVANGHWRCGSSRK